MAKSAVDAVIEKTFKDLKVRGFCHTRIAFCAETAPGVRNIFTCDIDGGDVKQITNFKSICVEPCWTPSGQSICYSKYGNSSISVIETMVASKRSRILSSFNGINIGASVSPDGENMAVILSFDHKVDLYVQNLKTRKLRRLTRGIAVEASPCWSPDSRRIAFVSDETGSPRIHVVGINGNDRKRIPTIGSDAVTPDWSGDNKIVFASRLHGAYTLGVFDFATGKSERATEAPGVWESPSWAPDNRHVVCKRTEGRKSALYVVDTRTGKVRPLLSTKWNLSTPAWSPGRPAK
jgi:TolB protein